MRAAFLTESLDKRNGWGRYSSSLIDALAKRRDVECFVATTPSQTTYAQGKFRLLPKLGEWSNLERWKKPLVLVRDVLSMRPHLRGFDVVHCLTERLLPLAYVLARGKHLIMTAHGTYALSPNTRWYLRYLYKRMYRSADQIICVSSHTEKRVASWVPEAKTFVINNGVDTQLADYPESPNSEGEYILTVGALKKRKGYHVTLAAFAAICADFPKLRYIIVAGTADPEYKAMLLKEIERRRLTGRVILKERISEAQLANLFRHCLFFILTPVETDQAFEGFGLVYLEAALFGKPSVGVSSSGSAEAIIGEETGVLVPQEDVASTAKAMRRLLDDSDLRVIMGKRSAEYAARSSWSKVADQYVRVYQSVLSRA
ncbi:MAG: hypothetical protein A2722_02940 [Candidatus Doudnabacteria bacterium RIFCSPHIGHO2_01_FULL_50_11]|uniref:Glycosyl transferase family 1 domain-containing protein n=1 Tax=Candidatus Doudnabacteria bacterium RIFCSPHIGHO2_01_FULL_50_11 TaxID=1817828 RepID=A0A1F5PHC6_9BACT|nr:MAG: hypothetical protein A2722_02940 [Candidatus Doudnabacteria bacterium RIFCSPHIGHO2_01_FULL_50_11]